VTSAPRRKFGGYFGEPGAPLARTDDAGRHQPFNGGGRRERRHLAGEITGELTTRGTRALAWLTLKDLRLRVRDRSAFVIGILAPFGLAVILNAVIGDQLDEVSADIAVVTEDSGRLGSAFIQALDDVDEVEVTVNLSEDEARRRIDDGDLQAAIVVPAGFTAAVDANEDVELIVVGHVDEEIATLVAEAVADGFADRIEAGQLSVATVLADGSGGAGDSIDIEQLVAFAEGSSPAASVTPDTTAERRLDTTTYLVAGMGVLFLFFMVQFGVRGLLDEQEMGTLPRLLAAPIPRALIPLSKALVSVVLGLVALAVLVVASTLALGADWGDPLAVAVLSVAVVLAATSIIGIVVVLARTSEQANNLQAIIAMVLGLLGGSFFPVSQGESLVTRLAVLTPHHWFLEGLGEASVGGIGDAVGAIVALLGFAVVVGGIGAVLMVWRGLESLTS